MGSAFNPQILVDKLVKLNSSQASIENAFGPFYLSVVIITIFFYFHFLVGALLSSLICEALSHWCIFHMNKAKHVVETWDRQFHLSPHEQRLAFLYLANDILQNSRRKGSEFVVEFWKVLPDALRDVIENGDESGRNAALRLIGIWEERKVFGLRAQSLKEGFLGEHLEKINRDGKHLGVKLPGGSMLDRIVSSFQVVYGAEKDEDVILSKCGSAMAYIDKVDKEIGLDSRPVILGKFHGAAFMEELQGQHAVLRDSIEQLTAIESSRTNLISRLREAILEQESKLEQVCHQLQAACSQSEQAGSLCQRLLHSHDGQLVGNQSLMEASKAIAAQSVVTGDGQESDPAMCKQQVSSPEKRGHIEEDPPPKSAAAAMAEKLTTSTSSAQMLSYVLSSLASEGVIGNSRKEPSSAYPLEKRAKLENHQPYIPTENHPQDPHPSFRHPESFPSNVTSTTSQSTANDPPPPPSSPPPLPPLPPIPQYLVPQYVPLSGSINGLPMYGVPYGFNMSQQLPPSLPGYPAMGTATTVVTPTMNSYQTHQVSEGNVYSLPSSTQVAMWNTSRFV